MAHGNNATHHHLVGLVQDEVVAVVAVVATSTTSPTPPEVEASRDPTSPQKRDAHSPPCQRWKAN